MKNNEGKALIIVDVQPGFITEANSWVIKNIQNFLEKKKYGAYVEVVFSAPKGSLWDRQMGWTFDRQETVPEIALLIPKDRLYIEKNTKSAFKGDKDLHHYLQEKNIQEVHIVGMDTNDCVFATANEAFDLGYFSYVIGGCTASSTSEEVQSAALFLLDELDMLKKTEEV